tara:strand:- start:216 stop:1487 length:1272 start_codon:yes stop_codon:yes gene_type:complete
MVKNRRLNFINQILLLFLFSLTFLNIASVGLPILFDLILAITAIIVLKRNKLILLNINVIFLLSIVSFSFLFKLENERFFYRGHEKFFKDKISYQKNINDIIIMKHGELPALDVCNNFKSKIQIPSRQQVFITDAYGFRNSQIDIKEAEVIIIGDSLISGGSASDEDILSFQLNKYSNLKTANLAMGGIDPMEYELILNKFLPLLKKDAKIFLFYYEGNDFNISNKNIIPKYSYKDFKIDKYKYKLRFGYERLERNKDKFFIKILNYENYFFKKIRPKSQRVFKKILSTWTNTCLVKYHKIQDSLHGFYWLNRGKDYIFKTHIISNKKILNRINKVFYIPTKASLYRDYLNKTKIVNYESNKFEFLSEEYKKKNIEAVNLTIPMKKALKIYMDKNEFLFFRDDTHLNKNGAEVIAKFLIKNNY